MQKVFYNGSSRYYSGTAKLAGQSFGRTINTRPRSS